MTGPPAITKSDRHRHSRSLSDGRTGLSAAPVWLPADPIRTGGSARDDGGVTSAAGEDRGQPSVQDTGGAEGRDDLAVQLIGFARSLHHTDDPDATLTDVVTAAVALIPGTEQGSISAVTGRRHVSSEAASGELPRIVDALQEETGQGPCLDSVFQQTTVRVTDMASETRWPEFARRAAAAGAASMLSIQLFVEGDNLGALNLVAGRPGAFDDESEHVGLLFASYAAIAYDTARQRSGMTRAVESRQLIGQAEGILMERHHLDAHDAFDLLVRASQHQNVKLRELADRLVTTGALTTPRPPRR